MNDRTLRLHATRLPHAADLPLPRYATRGAAGLDLTAAVADPLDLRPGDRTLVPTGLVIHLPEGYEGQVRPRSGLALKYGITCLNAPGTIDADYRGEVGVILINHGREAFTIERGMRIAQLVVSPVVRAVLVDVAGADPGAPGDDEPAARGTGGFGSTGVMASPRPING